MLSPHSSSSARKRRQRELDQVNSGSQRRVRHGPKTDHGKEFEGEIKEFFDAIADEAWDWSPNQAGIPNKRLPGDRIVFYRSIGCLLECKATTRDRLPYSEVKPHQRAHLKAVHRKGGIALVLVKHCTGRRPRAWAVPIGHWETRGGLALLDGKRPAAGLTELHRATIRRKPVWDLRPVLDQLVAARAERLVRTCGDQVEEVRLLRELGTWALSVREFGVQDPAIDAWAGFRIRQLTEALCG